MRAPLLLALCLAAAPACRRHRARAGVSWYVHPAEGRSVRLEGGCYAHGALRFTDASIAAPPWPVTGIAASARVDDAWLFAAEDGTVYRAPSCDGPLTVVAELPARLVAAFVPYRHYVRGVHSRGALFALDVHRRAHAVEHDGAARAMPLERVITGAFVDADTALAVAEPGVLLASRDGGRSFAVVPAPAGVPVRVHVVDGDAWVTTTGGAWRWRGGSLEPVAQPPDRESWVVAPREGRVRVRDFNARAPALPFEPDRVAALPDGTLAHVTDDALVTVTLRGGARRERREMLPNTGCAPRASGAGLRMVCARPDGTTAVFVRGDGPVPWNVLRDEHEGERPGALAFDDAGAAWAVSAPCGREGAHDGRALCVYDGRGGRRELRAPFPVRAVAMHAGELLAVSPEASGDGATRAVRVRDGALRELTLPWSVAASMRARWDAAGLRSWEAPTASGAPLAAVFGVAAGDGFAWRRVEAPSGARVGVVGPQGVVLAVGDTGAAVWASRAGAPFRAMTPTVTGHPSAAPIDHQFPSYCAGPWCSLGASFTLAFAPTLTASGLTRATPPEALRAPPPPRPRGLRCRLGAATPTPPLGDGVAMAGRLLRVTTAGSAVTAHWLGAAPATRVGALTARANARVTAHATPGADTALLEQCNDIACDHHLVTASGVRPLALGRGAPGGVEVFDAGGGDALLRFDEPVDSTSVMSLAQVDGSGTERYRRVYVLADDGALAHVGRWGSAWGLWAAQPDGALDFFPLQPDGPWERPAATARAPDDATPACPDATPPRGELRARTRPVTVWGDGWSSAGAAWHVEELLEVRDEGLCVRAVVGGAATSAPGAVRGFELTAASGAMRGVAWMDGRRAELSCEPAAPPP